MTGQVPAGTRQESRSRSLRLLPSAFMAAVVSVTYAAIVLTLPRGFDWTDEAFVDTMIASNRIATEVPLGFQHLLHPLYELTGQSALALRITRLVGYVLLSGALVWCARIALRWVGINLSRSGWAFVLLLAQVGTFLAWSYPPRYLSYNELGSWFSQLGVALILLALAWGVASPGHRAPARVLGLIWPGLGALTTLLLFAKVTSAMVFGVFLLLGLFIPNPCYRLWKRLLGAGAGATVMLLVLWATGSPIVAYLKNAFALVFDRSAQDAAGHPLSAMISTYSNSLNSMGRALVPALLLFTLSMATFRRKAKLTPDAGRVKAAATDWLTWVLAALLLVALATLPRAPVWPYLAVIIGFIGLAGTIGLVIAGSDGAQMRRSTVSRSLSIAIAWSAVLAAPFISAVGTNNGIAEELVFSATVWAVVLGIALVLLMRRAALLRSRARCVPALIGCVVVVMVALSVKADIAKPYRSLSLLSQDTSSSVPELRGILLTATDAAWIDWIYATGRSLGAAGVPTVAIDSPGALFAFNHNGYATPWLGHGNLPSGFRSLRLACATHPPDDLFVLEPGPVGGRASTDGAAVNPGVAKSLATCGISFPGDFRVAASRPDADPAHAMTIWRLKSR
ncbi:MAG: hypothetical protein H7270_14545 [Dermatophilaceae bacterium]|nr:hypothetical protein [Dermatophilaceae bacterium]